MKTVTKSITTTLITSDDGKKTFEIIKNLDGCEGECIYLISLYPTRNEINIFNNDSTLNALMGHIIEMGGNELHIINLNARLIDGKMSVRGLMPDDENILYISDLMRNKKFQSSKFVIAWGNSFQTSSALNKTKLKVLQMFNEANPKSKVYQLSLVGTNLESDIAPHPLYVNIRGGNHSWSLKEIKITDKMLNEYQMKIKDENVNIDNKNQKHIQKPTVSTASTSKSK